MSKGKKIAWQAGTFLVLLLVAGVIRTCFQEWMFWRVWICFVMPISVIATGIFVSKYTIQAGQFCIASLTLMIVFLVVSCIFNVEALIAYIILAIIYLIFGIFVTHIAFSMRQWKNKLAKTIIKVAFGIIVFGLLIIYLVLFTSVFDKDRYIPVYASIVTCDNDETISIIYKDGSSVSTSEKLENDYGISKVDKIVLWDKLNRTELIKRGSATPETKEFANQIIKNRDILNRNLELIRVEIHSDYPENISATDFDKYLSTHYVLYGDSDSIVYFFEKADDIYYIGMPLDEQASNVLEEIFSTVGQKVVTKNKIADIEEKSRDKVIVHIG